MKFLIQFRLLLITLLSAILLSSGSLLFLNRFADLSSATHRNRFLKFMAERIDYELATRPGQDPIPSLIPKKKKTNLTLLI